MEPELSFGTELWYLFGKDERKAADKLNEWIRTGKLKQEQRLKTWSVYKYHFALDEELAKMRK